MTKTRITLALLFLVGSQIPLQAENWPNWRGPLHNGATTEKGFRSSFTKSSAAWKRELPGEGAATPIVWGNSVFLTSQDEKEQGIVAYCISAITGKVRWKKTFGEGIRADDRSNFAGPSATTDGKVVVFFTGNGDLAAFDLDGKELWSRNIQKDYGDFTVQWTYSSSPLIYGDRLYIQVLQRDVPVHGKGKTDGPNDSYLLALDPNTGDEKWRHVRPAKAVAESLESFSTPVPILHGGREELLITGGDCITGHDPETGKELWRWGTWNPDRIGHWRLVPSATYGDGMILACAPKGAPVYAMNAGGKGTINDTALAWVSDDKQISSDVPTPLFYDGYFYIVNGRNKFVSCVDPKTGKVVWSEKLNSKTKLESSPTAADGKIYVMSHLGEVFVLKAGDKFQVLNEAMFGESQSVNIRASIVPANGRLFIRTDKWLYCVK